MVSVPTPTIALTFEATPKFFLATCLVVNQYGTFLVEPNAPLRASLLAPFQGDELSVFCDHRGHLGRRIPVVLCYMNASHQTGRDLLSKHDSLTNSPCVHGLRDGSAEGPFVKRVPCTVISGG